MLEIERRFLVKKDADVPINKDETYIIKQGYLSTDPDRVVRIRITHERQYQIARKAQITVKGHLKHSVNSEYEYDIPFQDGNEMIKMCKSVISKIRCIINRWEVDNFLDDNEGLVIAEIELSNENEKFDIPEWIGEEITGDHKYSNAALSEKPFKTWTV